MSTAIREPLKPKAIFFDWDGTLVDSSAHIVQCVKQSIEDLNRQVPEDHIIRDVIGLGLDEAIQKMLPDWSAADRLELRQIYRDHYISQYEQAQSREQFFPGTIQVLDTLIENQYTLAVATGKSRVGLNRALKAMEVGQYFFSSRTADETASKPDPMMLFELLEELELKPEETLMIGDTEYDLEMAVNAKVPSIAVSYGVHHVERLEVFNPVATIHDIRELLDCVAI